MIINQKSFSLVLFSSILVLAFFVSPSISSATEETFDYLQYLEELKNFGIVEGSGTHFEILDSDFLNIVLDSTENVSLRIESIPDIVTISTEASNNATSADVTISGFLPNTTYYKYQDDYHDLEIFTTDQNGTYTYTQDISEKHLVFIQTHKSTKFIADDASGGDCSSIGIWNSLEKICTLTTDLTETVQIDSDNITLDGNNHSITGGGTGNGVFVGSKTGVAIKNLNISNFSMGVNIYLGIENVVEGNYFLNNREAIEIRNSTGNTISNNLIEVNSPLTSRYQGLVFLNSDNNIVKDENILMNIGSLFYTSRQGIILDNSNSNIFSGNSISNTGQAVLYFDSVENIFKYNTIQNSKQDGVILYNSVDNQIYNNNFLSNNFQIRNYPVNNLFNLELPFGGNYFDNFDTIEEGCDDLDENNICDTSFSFLGGQDNLPWNIPNGWPLEPIEPENNPVILIPGTTGSYLFKDYDDESELWVNVPKLILSGSDIYLNDLALNIDGTENLLFPISVGDIIREEVGADVFAGLIDDLEAEGYVEGTDLFVFPYDWRKSNSLNAVLLKNKIDEVLNNSGASKVDIVAHSMGGLLTKKYIADEGDTKVDQLIFLGTPHLGAPKAFKALMYGDDLGYRKLFLGLNEERLKFISQNMPSVYELIPSEEYISKDGGYVINAEDKNNPITLNYVQTKDFMIEKGRNVAMFPIAQNLHDDIDSLDLSNIEVSNFVGCGTKTVGEITTTKKLSWTSLFLKRVDGYDLKYVNGDETVPIISANETPNANMYYAKKISHGSLPSASGVKEGIVSILKDEEVPENSNILESTSSCNVSGKNVSVHSPVELHIYDELGNHTGPNQDGDIENHIEGVQYDVIEDEKFAFLPDGVNYKIEMQATDVGSFDFVIKDQDQNDNETSTYEWLLVPIETLQTKGEIFVGPSYPALGYELKIDANGDDIFDNNILANQTVGVEDHLYMLEQMVNGLNLPFSTEHFLMVKIDFAKNEVEQGNIVLAIQKLEELIMHLENYQGLIQNISLEDRDLLVDSINLIIDELS